MSGPIDMAQLEHYLDEWAYWMESARSVRGFAGSATGMENARRAVNEDYQNVMYERADRAAAIAMDAAIESLVLHEHEAIYVYKGQASFFRFPRLNMAEVLENAKKNVGRMMREKGWPL